MKAVVGFSASLLADKADGEHHENILLFLVDLPVSWGSACGREGVLLSALHWMWEHH